MRVIAGDLTFLTVTLASYLGSNKSNQFHFEYITQTFLSFFCYLEACRKKKKKKKKEKKEEATTPRDAGAA